MKSKPIDLSQGTQILYVPIHAMGDTNHPDCEAGFVTSANWDGAWCRYWRKDGKDLRTKSYSEFTPTYAIVVKDTVPQEKVEQALVQIARDLQEFYTKVERGEWPAPLTRHRPEQEDGISEIIS